MPERKRKRAGAVPALAFNHAMVYVRDVVPALRFYSGLLGFKLVERFDTDGSPVYARLRSPLGQSTLALHRVEPGQALPATDGIRLYFEVRQLDKLCRDLEAAGVRFSQTPKLMPWGWKHAYLNDPDGHELSLYWAGAKRFRRSRMDNE